MSYRQAPGPVFIVGAPRSGTTLLQFMLRSHPDLSLPTAESHFIIPLWRRRAEFGDLSTRDGVRRVLAEMQRLRPRFLAEDLHGVRFDVEALAARFHQEGRDSIPALIDGLFAANAAGEGKSRWGDKTPYYVLHLPLLAELFPDARFVHIIRDGRDAALSMRARARDLNVYNLYHAAKIWEQYVEAGQTEGARLGPQRYFELRYEDLLSDQEGSVRRICEFLDLPFSSAVIEFRKARAEGGKTPLLARDIDAGNAEKWRQRMTPRQLALFEGAAKDTLLRNGYPLATPARRPPLPVRAALRAHNRLLRWINIRVNG